MSPKTVSYEAAICSELSDIFIIAYKQLVKDESVLLVAKLFVLPLRDCWSVVVSSFPGSQIKKWR
jgi:hypothetical protein